MIINIDLTNMHIYILLHFFNNYFLPVIRPVNLIPFNHFKLLTIFPFVFVKTFLARLMLNVMVRIHSNR